MISQAAEETETKGAEPPPGGGAETILVVDDNEQVQRVSKELLSGYGYSVIIAPDGQTALDIYRSKRRKIDLVLMDLVMPGIGGLQCLRQLLEIDPHARVIIATGQLIEKQMREDLKALVKGFVDKPNHMRQLLKAIRDAMKHC